MTDPLNLPFDPIERAAQRWEQVWGASAPMKVATSIMRVQQLLLSRFDAILRPHDLTFARYEGLVLLRFSRHGALPLGRIGERLMVHPTSVTNIVDRLAQQGFVERRPNPRDRRGVLAAITDAGRAVTERATADLMAADFGLDALRAAELADTFATLRVLRVAAGDFVDESVED